MNLKIGKIAIYGTGRDVETARQTLHKFLPVDLFKDDESKARLRIQALVDEHKLKAAILWDGNRVWSKRRIVRDFNAILRNGMQALTDYLYEFFHLCCGSIAHYDKHGWICEYPNLDALQSFFERNEYGSSVLAHQPHWASDRIGIITEMNQLLEIRTQS